MKLEGYVMAKDTDEAQETVEREQRKRWPEVKWMHGREVEGESDNYRCRFGPTTQMLKGKKSLQPNVQDHRSQPK